MIRIGDQGDGFVNITINDTKYYLEFDEDDDICYMEKKFNGERSKALVISGEQYDRVDELFSSIDELTRIRKDIDI